MQSAAPVVKQLVLVGGGHSHLAVLRRFAMEPVPGLGLTLISKDILTPYSGALPAYLGGRYRLEDMHIDLRPLAQAANVRLIQAEVGSIDLDNRCLTLPGRPALEFDLISLNIGSQPDPSQIPGAKQHAVGIKPISSFLESFEAIRSDAINRLQGGKSGFALVIVGGGPASVELAFAVHSRLQQDLELGKTTISGLDLQLVSADSELLINHNSRVRRYALGELQRRGVTVHLNSRVAEFTGSGVGLENGQSLDADASIFATGASLPAWPLACGLAPSDDGFIEVNDFLQSTSHDMVFAAGDAASIRNHPRPKSGVFAVRAGKILADNLARFARGRRLRRYRPQKQALALMSMGDERAIASRGPLFFKGRLPWLLKDRIDSDFVRKYSRVESMPVELNIASGLLGQDEERRLREHVMRCAGCGAKIASDVLEEVLEQLPQRHNLNAGVQPRGFEDASLISLGNDRTLLQSVDYLKAFTNDPWLFGRITANHCLSDIYAMGAMPHSALSIVGLPQSSRRVSRSMLLDLMLGCQESLNEDQCDLLGGHTTESAELSLGLSVNGFSDSAALLRKQGMSAGDRLLLTGPLGTGCLLAADMRAQAAHSWMQEAIEHMLQSNRSAAELLLNGGATACTDITGFGLAGHLLEMMRPDNAMVELELDSLPVLSGASACLERSIVSSLHADNRQVLAYCQPGALPHEHFELLFDPQTAGGLLATVPADSASACLTALQAAGYRRAAIIGQVQQLNQAAPALMLK